MPVVVPRIENFGVMPTAGGSGGFRAPAAPDVAGAQARATGQGLMQAGGDLGRIALDMQQQANDTRVNDATNQAIEARTALRLEAMQAKGKAAFERESGKPLDVEFGEKLQERLSGIAEQLGNDAQRRAFGEASGRMLSELRVAVSAHMAEQQLAYQKSVPREGIVAAQNQGVLLRNDPAALAQSSGAIKNAIQQLKVLEGWDDRAAENALAEAMSPLHVGVMRGMITDGHASAARAYYDENAGGMTLAARAQMQGVIKGASDAQAADGAADAVWGALAPKTGNEAVRLFDMEAQLREKLRDNPDALRLGVAALRERASAFNAQQAESNAQAVNGVFAQLDGGASLRQVQRSEAWLTLPELKQHEILKSLEAEAATRESRAAARESRAASAAQRELAELQRADHLSMLRNADQYLAASDPAKLSTMTRAEVAALRPTFGLDGTQHLLARWDALQSADAKLGAEIDGDTFKQVAQEMGLAPFKKGQTDDEKAALGALKYRTEKLIEIAQKQKGSRLTRAETEEVMRGEMARTVTVDGWFLGKEKVPVIALTDKQVAKVLVPDADRAQIVDALRRRYQQDPSNPLFAPTEANVRRLYLMNQSRAGEFLRAE